jgi:hypothetical protein
LAFGSFSPACDLFPGRDDTGDLERGSPEEASWALSPAVYVVWLTMEESPTDLLISGSKSVIALTLGHREEPVVNIKIGAVFPTATYQFLRDTNASDPSTYRHQGIADIIADVMPNGRECISLVAGK